MSKARGELTLREVMKLYGYTAFKLKKASDSDPSAPGHLRNRQDPDKRGYVRRYYLPEDVEKWIDAQYR
jgi:hypothetical protein